MTDFEAIIDKRIQQAAAFYGDSDTYLKVACFAAVWVVGRYDGATQQIATKSRRSVATVENWSHAARLYQELRRNGNCKLARQLWRSLPTSHWWQAYGIQQSGYDALYYLLGAHQYSWSGRGMMGEFEKDRNAGHAPLIFKRAKLSFYGLALELARRMDELTVPQVAAVEAVRKAFVE